MADITWDQVLGFAAELSSVPGAARETILEYVNTSLKPTYLGGAESAEYTLARIYLAAHLGLGVGAGGATGAVIAEGLGGITAQYAFTPPTTGDEDYGSTNYGRKFLSMIRHSSAKGGLVV